MQLTRRAVLGALATVGLEVPGAALAQSGPITGFNQNWSMLPALDTPGMIDNIRRLKPQMLRYPGGTVTHSWDWRAGVITSRKPLAPHPVSDVKRLAYRPKSARWTSSVFSLLLHSASALAKDCPKWIRKGESVAMIKAKFRLGRLGQVHIRVPDRAAAARWYAEHLGLAPLNRIDF